MSLIKKQKRNTKNDTSESTRPRGKAGKILTTDRTGMPCYGKIEKTVGFHPETTPIYEMVLVYENCNSCGLSLGRQEVVNGDVLDGMCIDCFSESIGEESVFSQINLYQTTCTGCAGYMEEGEKLLSTMERICNHCYMRLMGTDKNHSYIRCDPSFPMPRNNLHEKIENIVSVENPKNFLKTNKTRRGRKR